MQLKYTKEEENFTTIMLNSIVESLDSAEKDFVNTDYSARLAAQFEVMDIERAIEKIEELKKHLEKKRDLIVKIQPEAFENIA